MESEKETMFRNAIGGYHKADVNEYIARMAQEFSRRSDDWDTEKGKLLRELSDAKTDAEQAAKLRDELACQVYEAGEELRQKQSMLDEASHVEMELKASIAGLSARIHELETALAEKTQALAESEETRIAAYNDASDELDEELYGKLSSKVEDIMAAANESAKEIVASALSRGDEIVAEAEKKAEKIRCDAMAKSDEMTGRIKDECQTAANDYYEEVMRFAAEIRESLGRLMQEIDEKKAGVDDKIESMRLSFDSKKRSVAPPDEKESPEKMLPEKNRESKGTLSSIDEKIESFFKNTIHAINNMTRKKK